VTLGLVGAGNMARALARGWAQPVLCTDGGSGRAAQLAAELGGEALGTNADLTRRAEVIVLAHKPAQLQQVASEAAPGAAGKLVVSLLARVERARVAGRLSGATVVRVQPEPRRGAPLRASARRARRRAASAAGVGRRESSSRGSVPS
jgi:pyrroline-5-carboxylate reductase